MSLIQNFIGGYKDNATKPAMTFKPAPDERIVFFNYTTRDLGGNLPSIPALVSTTANEVSTLSRYPLTNITDGPYQPTIDAGTVSIFVCLASNTTALRAKRGLTTYRYEYAGNFSSITPLPWMGAYHAADIPPIFGTYQVPTPGRMKVMVDAVTSFERKVAEALQDHVLAFMQDPEDGLRNRGWPAYADGAEGRNLMRFGAGGNVQRRVSAGEVDDACIKGNKWNNNPS